MKNLKKISILFLLFLVLNVLYACSKMDSSSNTSLSYSKTESVEIEENYSKDKETTFTTQITSNNTNGSTEETGANVNANSSSNRKLIRRIQMSVETLDFDETVDFIMNEVNRLGGYSESSKIDGRGYNNSQSRYASLTLRIPSNQVEQLLSLVDKEANVLSKEETTEDVTLSYVDTESRVKSLEIQQERLLDLLENADSLENIITLEQRLSEVRYEIEEYASRLRTYDNLVEYSTLSIEISEVNKITPIVTKGILDRMGSGITKSLSNVYNGFINFIVWLVVNLPYIIIWSGIIFVAIIVYIKISRRYMNPPLKSSKQLPDDTKVTRDDNIK